MTRISIINLEYKVELKLACCVDSILAQTFIDFDMILVDDGSLDRNGVILDRIARIAKRRF